MRKHAIYIAVGFASTLLAGCASQPSTADLMRAHADEAQARVELRKQFAADWDRGSELVRDGEKRISKGEKQIDSAEQALEEGREQVTRGNREIEEGRRLLEESERQFKEHFPGHALSSGS
ncbi:hypothetical protein LPB260_18620 [Pseudomonas sp. LPB0260]|uniref:hypothetical protein n=1 Tax=Pseudomonas sp. LPB0260 TaxID=2614442 RepID=UPI0015C2B109|nr:hypothetical protein [Pseudomonas sp. LPB0260]QLC72773.1 hypothetical protein LPB260_03670 [Pseudomonas sp. LPB0260]QLC75547.1 hypothetical protein LPB260_18620 [Pseudomonas sp. LPB0260]